MTASHIGALEFSHHLRLLILLPAKVDVRSKINDSSGWALASILGSEGEVLAQIWQLWPFAEWTNGWKVSDPSIPLPVHTYLHACVCHSALQINLFLVNVEKCHLNPQSMYMSALENSKKKWQVNMRYSPPWLTNVVFGKHAHNYLPVEAEAHMSLIT